MALCAGEGLDPVIGACSYIYYYYLITVFPCQAEAVDCLFAL